MRRFELLTLRCKMCDWQWEVTPQEPKKNFFCEHCGSNDVIVKKENLQIFKQNGKIITDIGFASSDNRSEINNSEDISDNFEKPLLVVKENNIRIPDELTNEDRISILGRIDSIKSRILQDIKNSQDDSFTHLK